MRISDRFAFLGSAAAVIVVVGLVPVHVAGQGQRAGATETLRTAWGAPDLQGIWQNEDVTPFERPKQFAGREFLTDAERAAQDKQRAGQAEVIHRDKRGKAGTEQDVAGAYNAIWQGDGTVRHSGKRTSQVIDPPDGRIPPRTPESKKSLAAQRDYLNMLCSALSAARYLDHRQALRRERRLLQTTTWTG